MIEDRITLINTTVNNQKVKELFTGSAKRLNKNGCTSSRVSGPPRLSSRTPTFSVPRRIFLESSSLFDVINASEDDEYLLKDPWQMQEGISWHRCQYSGGNGLLGWHFWRKAFGLPTESWRNICDFHVCNRDGLHYGKSYKIILLG